MVKAAKQVEADGLGVQSEAERSDAETAQQGVVEKREVNVEAVVPKAPTVADKKKEAKEVDEGETAEELLEQALPYVGGGTPESFVGNPERWKNVKAKIEAYFTLKGK